MKRNDAFAVNRCQEPMLAPEAITTSGLFSIQG